MTWSGMAGTEVVGRRARGFAVPFSGGPLLQGRVSEFFHIILPILLPESRDAACFLFWNLPEHLHEPNLPMLEVERREEQTRQLEELPFSLLKR